MATQSEITNAFVETIPPSAFASSSSSSPSQYDIFINHRGPDCKHKLASTIYQMLDLLGKRVFLDEEELELGDCIPIAIQEAMRNASVHIAIFSRSYAQSPWCLAELSFMLQTRTRIIPVFYHVDPSDLRWPDGKKSIYAHAFAEHERNNRYSSERLKEWKMALQQASHLSGCIIPKDNENASNTVFSLLYTLWKMALQQVSHLCGCIIRKDNDDEGKLDEGKLLRSILEGALLEAKKTVSLETATYPVGLDEAVKDFNSRVEPSQTDENVQIVGIVGKGGSGKTTLATEIYNRKCSDFDRCSFLPQVRDAASRDALQKKLLRDLLGREPDSITEGKRILARTLRSMSVLIVLDNVDDVDQMHALLPAKQSLGRGSFILVTARKQRVLKSWGISCIYQMRLLEPFYARQLFCNHAFLQPYSNIESEGLLEDFKDLIEKFVLACNGLPLSLKVLGAQLNGESKEYWKSELEILPTKFKERLRVSYNALEAEQKEIFLDTACFFIGEQLDLAITVWDGAGWYGLYSWKTLVNKCLVEVDQDNRIKMHDHLRDLGRELATEHSPSRLWLPEQIDKIQQGMPIRGIMGATNDTLEYCMKMSSPGLQLLDVKENDLPEKFSSLLKDLVWLRLSWPHTNLPLWLLPANLRVLELQGHKLDTLWDNNVNPPLQLRELIISTSERYRYLSRLPRSIGNLTHLKKLVLRLCYMRGLPNEFCSLKALEHLELHMCVLSELPNDFGKLAELRHLHLCSSTELRTLPYSFKELKNLQYLDLSSCFKLTSKMSDMLENMTKLETLRLSGCGKLQELPHLRNQASLRELCVTGMSFRDVPSSIGDLRKLEVLNIGSENLESLPESIGKLSCLTHLSISGCKKLQCLPDSVGRLNLLKKLEIYNSGVEFLPEALGQLTNLETLEISYCCPLRELAFMSASSSFFCKLKRISLRSTRLSKISISEDSCPSLENLILRKDSVLTEINSLPRSVKAITLTECQRLKNFSGIRGLTELQRLEIYSCPELDELPSLAGLTSIKEISIEGCPKVEKIQGFQHLRSLEVFSAHTCWKESGIESLEQAERLR